MYGVCRGGDVIYSNYRCCRSGRRERASLSLVFSGLGFRWGVKGVVRGGAFYISRTWYSRGGGYRNASIYHDYKDSYLGFL